MLTYCLADVRVMDGAQKPIPRAQVTISTVDSSNRQYQTTCHTDSSGRAIFAVPQVQIPLIPRESEFTVTTDKGGYQTGKLRCGGNESVRPLEVVLSHG